MVKLGLATNNRRKNQQTGNWDDVPMFIDVSLFGKGDNRWLDIVAEQPKGTEVCIFGHLELETWEKDGQKRSKHVIVAEDVQLFGKKADGAPSQARSDQGSRLPAAYNPPPEDDIPF